MIVTNNFDRAILYKLDKFKSYAFMQERRIKEMKKIFSVLMITMLMVSSLFSVTAFATSNEASATANQQNEDGKRQPPKDMKNFVLGKITAISENSVTISVAEFKKPENGNGNKFDGNPPEKPNNQTDSQANGDASGNKERAKLTDEQIAEMKKKMEEMFTLTGDTKTIDISQATFGQDRGRGQNNKDNNSTNNNSNDNANNQNNKKTYKDYAVGDYITIELTAENSNVAKQVRDMRPMGGGPRGQFGNGNKPNGKNGNKNNNN